MGEKTGIEWAHHTFNPWWGCTKVSAGCDFCYAEAMANRLKRDIWGATVRRGFLSDEYWKQPERWNAKAARECERRRVFCASMADVFERRRDVEESRARLWELIGDTRWLDWMLLTKRPHLARRQVPWLAWPSNVWLGTSAEDQKVADIRVPQIVDVDVKVRFVSAEPLLGPVDLSPWIDSGDIHWVIAGGETGPNARPVNPRWIEDLLDQCEDAHVPFFFKQWGEWAPVGILPRPSQRPLQRAGFQVERGRPVLEGVVERCGRRRAGRKLRGRVWEEFPQSAL